jgi:uncharacterized protein (DUF58 family)
MNDWGEALRGLTTRGRSLLAAGVTLSICALVLGQRDLLRAGVFLLALPLAAAGFVVRTRYRLACSRRLDPARVECGRETTVRLRLDNVSRLASGVLLMEDALPFALGGRPRFVLDKVEPHGVREVSYPVRPEARGRYRIGPLSVRLTDPFGMCELTRSFAGADDLIVTPTVSPLPVVRLGGDWAGGGDSTTRSVAATGSDDAATREYRHGDDLRKVHWRSTARVGELMVRREEQPFQSRATLLLDGRLDAHRGTGPASSYEYAVSATASIAVALARAGFVLRILSETGEDLVPPAGLLTEAVVLDTLATAEATRTPALSSAITRLRTGIDGVLVAVLGAMDATDAELLARLRMASGTCIALLLDTETWGAPTARARVAEQQSATRTGALLAGAGWRVLPVVHGTPLASVWPLAGSRPGVRDARVPGVPA